MHTCPRASIRRFGVLRAAPARLLFLALSLAALAQAAEAQVLYGSITGNVSDQTGAALTGARVEVVNTETGVLKNATTDERGGYLLTDLQPGAYKVTVSSPGFRQAVRTDQRVDSNAVLRVDVKLEVSGVSDAVEVVATTPQLQTDRGDLHLTQNVRQVNELPLTGSAGRNYQSLMTIVPGAVMAGEQNSAAGSPQRSISFNVNGVSRLQNNTRLDGASVVYPWLPTNTAYVPSSEAIQEVSIVTNSYNAGAGTGRRRRDQRRDQVRDEQLPRYRLGVRHGLRPARA